MHPWLFCYCAVVSMRLHPRNVELSFEGDMCGVPKFRVEGELQFARMVADMMLEDFYGYLERDRERGGERGGAGNRAPTVS